MKHGLYAIRDTCVGAFLMPMVFQNNAAAVRSLGDAVNRQDKDSNLFQHPEHFQLYGVGEFDDESGVIEPMAPVFIVDCQSLVRS